MITKTSLQHPLFRARLDKAMREAAKYSHNLWRGTAQVSSITVLHFRNHFRAFVFLDSQGRDITSTVLTALREVTDSGLH